MKVFRPCRSKKSQYLHTILDSDIMYLSDSIRGSPVSKNWKAMPVKIIRSDEEEGKLNPSDAPDLTTAGLVLSEAAESALWPLIEGRAELLQLDCKDAVFSLLNVIRIIDALDERQSELVRFSSGRIMRIVKHVFDESKLSGETVFRISNLSSSPIYFTSAAVDIWKGAGLRGLDFKLVWEP